MSDFQPLRRGHVLLVAALNAREWTQYRLAEALPCRFPVVSRVIRRQRGIGLGLAGRIDKALDGAVPVASWNEDATQEEAARFDRDLAALLNRGHRRSTQPAPEAP